MPIFVAGQEPPPWCELSAFEIVALVEGEERRMAQDEPRTRVIVTEGTVQAVTASGSKVLKPRQFLDLDGAGPWTLRGVSPTAGVVVFRGRWGDEVGGCGLFEVRNGASPSDRGDPVDYPKSTALDSHYHDCEEYWVILAGSGTVVVDGEHSRVGPGDCVAIGAGRRHDFPDAPEPVSAVFFETTLLGRKRIGHLWEHTHGPARPLVRSSAA